ncbi:MAG TPA: ABC transporter permease [Cyclobacteriaceae bacterium]
MSKWLRLLEWFCPPSLYEGIEGDLVEQYEEDVKFSGEKIAKKRLMIGVLRFFRPAIILRNRFTFQLINTVMLRNYITIAFRNVLKNKVFSAINIFGLGIGLAACLLIFQFVSFELNYDKFNEKYDRIYRITNDRFQNGKLIQHGTITYPTIGSTMMKDYPEIEEYTRILPGGEMNVKVDDKNFRGDEGFFTDDHLLSIFSIPWIAGDKSSALKDKYSVVLTAHVAKKYFEMSDNNFSEIIGKTFYWGLDTQPYVVKGICGDTPDNSHFKFDVLASYATLITPDNEGIDDSWTWSDMFYYVLLKPGVDYKQLEAKFPAFSERYFQGDKVSGSVEKFYLQPLSEAHLYSDYEYDFAIKANGKAVWAMLIVALFILLIAWINYINLTTSRALDRAKEVGLRKVMGAYKSQLVKQFIFESLMITGFAFVLALIIVLLLQSSFNQLIGGSLSLWKIFMSASSSTILIMCLVLVAGALISGFYPAFVLSSYQPVTVLKGKFQRSSGGNFLRKALVVFQFTSSAALITGTIIVSKQLNFMNEADLGINIDNTVVVRSPELMVWDSTFIDRVESYKHALSQIDGVTGVATSARTPGDRLGRSFGIRLSDQPSDAHYTVSNMGIDYDFLETFKVKLLAGRNFMQSDHKVNFQDLNTVIINNNAAQLLGIAKPEDAIGKEVIWGNNNTRKWTIVGVVEDFHQESLRNPKEPIIFRAIYSTYSSSSIKIKTDNTPKVVASIETVYKQFFPGNSFIYSFLKDRYNSQYSDDTRFGKVISVFTVLAIIVSCLGLVGLSSYTALQRTKEIGIRKVLGASIPSIVSLLSLDFVRLVIIAGLLSIPIAWYSMHNWLEGYAYRISPSFVQFVIPVTVLLLIALLTISFQVLRAAMTDPAKTLKYE